MKTNHRLWLLTVLFISLVLCILSTAQEAINADHANKCVTLPTSNNITRGTSSTATQTLNLGAGWHWVSFPVLPTSHKVGDVLGSAGFTANDIIQTNDGMARFNGSGWLPSNFTIEYGKMYQIYLSNSKTVTISGEASKLWYVPLAAGWNWIANMTQQSVTPTDLAHNGGWTAGDRIQTVGDFVTYTGSKWVPSAGISLEPSKGYQIYSGNNGALVFPADEDEDDLYVVIDLSGGPDAINYPVRNTNTPPNLNDDACRTTELWLRKIPAGTFIMGAPEDEVGRQSGYDMAQHEVTLTQDYYIGVFECTQKQWELVMGSNPSYYKGDCRPVERVSYNMIRGTGAQTGAGWPIYGHEVDTESFMGKLKEKTGLVFDLPTEAQWEYACRAGTTTALNSGKNLTNTDQDAAMAEVGRYYYNQSDGKGGYSEHTKVGSYLRNAWGLYDMHGNVWEWCLDWWEAGTTSTTAETDPVGPTTGANSYRVLRSGGWYYYDNKTGAQNCRSAYRNRGYLVGYDSYVGFRVALQLPQDRYAVVDLSGGPDATNYPVRYSSVGPNLADDTCRTTELWLRKIPAGTFIMGSPDDEVGRSINNEMVLHKVTITQDYYIGVFECTQKQWELVMGSNPSDYKGDCRPVECVSYNMIRGIGEQAGAGWPIYGHAVDSTSFMGKLKVKTGLVFDLPTGTQWEYACRAGTTTALNSGKNLMTSNEQTSDAAMDEVGRYLYNHSDGKGGYSEHTKVGSYLQNAWGLYDMHGNVHEWCLDWGGSYTASTVAETNPVGPSTGSYRIIRGGDWNSYARYCRSAYWLNSSPSNFSRSFGFRIALLPSPPEEAEDMYAVVDLSSGPDSTSYPVRYTNMAPNLDDDTCRTMELWLRKIPAGTFIMGAPEDEVGRQSGYDMAQHEVTLTQDYYIGVFECTQKQWELVMGSNPSYYKGDCRPVERVSYNMIRGTGAQTGAGWPIYGHEVDTESFMGKLKEKTGLVFDLPTEAQWEYACRAGTTTALNSGKNLTNTDQDAAMAEVGRYYYNQSDGKGGYSEHTKVGSYLRNAWGLYDMHGNVWEWCLDWWEAGTTSTTAETDPVGPTTGANSYRVLRSGGWYYYDNKTGAQNCRSAYRNRGYLVGYDSYVGFRVALQLPQDRYAVVDLSGGPDATNYPVRYSSVGPNLADDTCRTTELWLRKIPAGTFIMGSPEDEVGRDSNDMTQHEVTLTQDYYIGVFECTQKQWELVMGSRPSYFNDDTYCATRPVEQVSYNMIRGTSITAGAGWPIYGHEVDVESFMGRLQAKTGLVFDLPTEAQWEYACRAGSTTALNSGKNLTSTSSDANMAEVGRYWYNGGTGYSQNCDPASGTAKVGSYLPNAWGLYDMHGNIWECCLDWWGASTTSTAAVTDPVGSMTGSYRVLRSGGWSSYAYNCRSAYRSRPAPSYYGSHIGFRIVLHPKQDLYAIIDLSCGPDATNYPVRYTDTAPNLDDDTCRTTELWLRKIPRGTFIMGSPEDEVGRRSEDMAQHEVTLTQDYYIGVFECTQRQWELVMGSNPSSYKGDCRPVEQVSYDIIRGTEEQVGAGWPTYGHTVDSTSFMGKLQMKTGLVFDLPTEAQWEYACRAGTITALNSGKNLTSTSSDANMAEVGRYQYNKSDGKGGYSQHTKVGSYLSNAWGIYDMHGNVNEWCLDWWGASTSSTVAVSDPAGPTSGSYRVSRGGCWYDYIGGQAQGCRSASRGTNGLPSGYGYFVGFRLVCLP